MFSDGFSICIGAICLVLAVVFFMTKGAGVIKAFENKNAPKKKKKSPEDEKRYKRAFGIFCLIMALAEFSSVILPLDDVVVGIVSIVVVVLDLIFIVIYLRKNFPEG